MSILQHSTNSVGYLIRGYPLKVVLGGALVWDHVSKVQVNHHPIEGRGKSSATKHTGELGDRWELDGSAVSSSQEIMFMVEEGGCGHVIATNT